MDSRTVLKSFVFSNNRYVIGNESDIVGNITQAIFKLLSASHVV